ncbi:hypothetical protein D3C72_1513010 [compost metagenome]
MIDQHFLAGGDVEFVRHQAIDQLPRQLGVAGKRRQGGDAPAFVGVVVLRGGADGEGRQLVEEEVQAVVVVDHDRHVWLHLVQPLLHRRETVKERLPVRVLLQVLRDGAADGRNV